MTHIFVVGVHRSGTTLLRHTLNDCPTVAVCGETYYMGHILPWAGMRQHFRQFYPLSDEANVRRLVEHMYTPVYLRYSKFKELGGLWKWIVKSIPSETLCSRLLLSERSESAIFDECMKLYAEHYGAAIRGEKTPLHYMWSETILRWYPGAKFVHMIRDPRGVHVSDLKRRREQKSRSPVYQLLRKVPLVLEAVTTVETTIMWALSVSRSRQMSAAYPHRYRIVRFEDLIDNPGEVIPALCKWLGIEFDPRMLDRSVVSVGVNKGQKGFDRTAAQRWPSEISRWALAWYRLLFRQQLRDLGYS